MTPSDVYILFTYFKLLDVVCKAEEPGRLVDPGVWKAARAGNTVGGLNQIPHSHQSLLMSSDMDFSSRCDTVSARIYLIFLSNPGGRRRQRSAVSHFTRCYCLIWNQTERFPVPLRQRTPCVTTLADRVVPRLSSPLCPHEPCVCCFRGRHISLGHMDMLLNVRET